MAGKDQKNAAPTSHPAKTYELRIRFTAGADGAVPAIEVKQRTIALIKSLGVDAFVEGAIDGLDIDNEFTNEPRDFYTELGGQELPISVFKYSREFLDDIRIRVEHHFNKNFPGQVECSMHEMDTAVWLEGWKESFKPLITERFAIYPPWEKPSENIANGRILLEIEPGIAFGTGQHATTQLCLRVLENIDANPERFPTLKKTSECRVLDVGTGTGILALGATRLGFASVAGTDIDPDAVLAARNNAAINSIQLDVAQTTVPSISPDGQLPKTLIGPFDIVVANILKVVLEKILPDLSRAVAPGGLLVMSGLLDEDAEAMIAAAAAFNMTLNNKTTQDDWACLVLQKSAETSDSSRAGNTNSVLK